MAKDRQTQPEVTGPTAASQPDVTAPVLDVPAAPAAPAAPPLKKFLVSLPKHKSRQVDDMGRPVMVDKLLVEAETAGDAIQKFNEFNGILSTQHKHVVENA